MKYHNHPLDKVSLQLVMGTVDKYTFTNILRDCSKYGFTLTLLGYKDVGRGKDFKPINYDWMLEDLIKFKKDNYLSLGIDTAIASEFEPQLKKRKISDLLYKTEEGKFSCYVDLVSRKMGPSSYCKDSKYVDLDISYKFEEIYQSF
jgi:hypothetical protein